MQELFNKIPLEYYSWSALLNFATCTAITVAVLLKNRESRLVRLFSVFTAELSLWSLLYAAWLMTPDPRIAEFLVRTCMLPVTVMPGSFLHFISELTRKRVPRVIHMLNYGAGIFFALTVYTPLFAIHTDEPFFAIPVWPSAGPLFTFHMVQFLGNVFYAHVMMYQAARIERGMLRTQIVAIFWGSVIAFVAGPSSYMPWYRIPIPPVLHPLSSVFVAIYAYAIIRYRLLDIEHLVKRSVVFTGLVGFAVAFMAIFPNLVLHRFLHIQEGLASLLGVIITVAFYGRVQNWLINRTEVWLFQKKYDYKELLKSFTDEVVTVLDLRKLVEQTVERLVSTIKLEASALLLLDKTSRTYHLAAYQGIKANELKLDEASAVVRFLRRTQQPLVREAGKRFELEEVEQLCDQLSARLCLPLVVHDELIGILSLGKKKSDEEFTKDDLDILSALSKTLAIAIANAQLFDELAKTQAEAAQKEKLAVIGTLSAGINHEICNPLGIVKAQCEAFLLDLQDGILQGKPSQEILDRASTIMNGTMKQIDRATAITQKLSNFAKPIKEPVVAPVSVAKEIDEVLALVGHDLKLEKIEVKKEVPQDLPSIVVDRRQLQEVLFNLIRNAAQAIHPPGSITISVYSYESTSIRIEIRDTGVGIPPDKLGKIYDPFFTTKEPGKGTGLGLFIVRQLVERNKGRISVESQVGKGTTFFLEFPVAKEAVVTA